MKSFKSQWNGGDARHRAKRIVSMCLNNDINGIKLPDPAGNLTEPEDILEYSLPQIDNIDNTCNLHELPSLNSMINQNDISLFEHSIDNTDYTLTELLPMAPEHDFFGLLDTNHLENTIYCEDTDNLSNESSIMVNYSQPIAIPETPNNSSPNASHNIQLHSPDMISETPNNSSPNTSNNNQLHSSNIVPDTPNNSATDISTNIRPHSTIIIPETPNNSATDTSCCSLAENAKVKISKAKSVKYVKLAKHEKKMYPIKLFKCKKSCRRDCFQFSDLERKKIWENYWRASKDVRLQWLARNIHLQPIAQRTTASGHSHRNTTRQFFLENKRGHSLRVCKTFFLNTLGMKNDSIITTVSKKIKICPLNIIDKRGRNNKQKIDTKFTKEHIMRYKPCIAHYRRHNSPLTRYLNQDITLVQLYKDYIEQYPNKKCCIEIYRRTLKKMNISLHRPQCDKCFDCELFKNEATKSKETNAVLPLQKLCQIVVHQNKAKEANSFYKQDAERESQPNTKIYSMDLEKSLLLPIMPDVKDCFFTSRLVAFNLTFAGLKKKDAKTPAKCIVWHEATSGRDAKNIVDAVYKLIVSERDTKHFVFWADNCSSQNKNWFIFTSLVTIVNSLEIESVTIKYLTKGHTHMTADGVHGNIENNIRKLKYIYDFEDFKTCIRTSRKDTVVLEVTKEEVFDWNKKKRNVNQKDKNDGLRSFLLKDVVEVKFVKGERTLMYKKKFKDEYGVLDFLQKKYSVHELPKQNLQTSGRGIKTIKKNEIINKLVPLMPTNRRLFWMQLHENSSSLDLIDEGEVVCSDT